MKTPKKLFRVTIGWNPSDASEGDFSELVWAKDEESAKYELARRMSFECVRELTPKERRMDVEDIAYGAGPYCVEDVVAQLPSLLTTLLAGPRLALTLKRARALQDIFKILKRIGVRTPLDA